jgi:hypothetical protein
VSQFGRLFSSVAERILSRSPNVSRSTRHDAPKRPGLSQPSVGLDPGAVGRAAAAYRFEFDKWQGLIAFAMADRSRSPEQRAAAVASLRAQQRIAAAGARKRVMQDEKQKAKAARRAARNLLKVPATPR